MRAFGAPEHIIEEKFGLQDESAVVEIEVWYTHLSAVNVFMRSKAPIMVGMSGGYHDVVSGQEVESVCRMLRIPRAEWFEILDDVQLMSSISARIKNDSHSSRSESKPPVSK
jgi:hypothetical protein